MKKEFEDFFEDLNEDEIEKTWNLAKREKRKRKRLIIVFAIIVDCIIFYFFNHRLIQLGAFGNNIFSIMKNSISSPGTLPILEICLLCDAWIYWGFGAFINKNKNLYNIDFKEKVVKSLIKNFFTEVNYFPIQQFPMEMYDMAKYEENYNKYYSDDYVEAKINDKYSLKMGEVTTKKVTYSRRAGIQIRILQFLVDCLLELI